MNVILMMNEVADIPNPMISESALPHLGVSPDEGAKLVRKRSLDELNSALDGYVWSRGKQKMNMVGHDNKGVQRIASFATVMIESLEK